MTLAAAIIPERIFDGERMLPPRTAIEFADGLISYVGPPRDSVSNEAIPPDATVMPGFVDLHNYLSIDPNIEGFMGQMYSDDLVGRAWTAARHLRSDLRGGTTTMRVMGEGGGIDLRAREAISAGALDGPRLFTAGRPIASSRSHQGGEHGIDGVAAVREAVRKEAAKGVDWIKILLTGGVNSTGIGATEASYGEAEISAALEEAAAAGLPVAGAGHGGNAVIGAVAAGIRTIEHGALFGDAEVDAMIRSGATLVLTPARFFHPDGIERSAAGSADTLARLENARATMRNFVADAVRRGLKIALGGDNMHGMQNENILCLLELGIDLPTALKAATSFGADVLGERDIGRLMPGKRADFIVIDGDPTRDPTCLRKIAAVYTAGRLRLDATAD